jgi:heme-degrading monooxygenase HmoA
MYARATTLTVAGERQSESVEQYRAALSKFRQIPGNRGAFLLVDEGGGRGVGVTLWGSEDAMTESRERADELRQQAAAQAAGEIVSVDEYEVAVWDVEATAAQ